MIKKLIALSVCFMALGCANKPVAGECRVVLKSSDYKEDIFVVEEIDTYFVKVKSLMSGKIGVIEIKVLNDDTKVIPCAFVKGFIKEINKETDHD